MIRRLIAIPALLLLASSAARAGDVKMDDAAKRATAKALEWLAKKQNADGSWGGGKYEHNTGITGFALLAFMSQGHLPGQGLYGPEVAKGARFLVASARPGDGYLIGTAGGNMYAHGMSTLVLCELWGMTQDEELKPILEQAVGLIVGCQHKDGGWRYAPTPTEADISSTIMQVMALRAAKNSGLHVPESTLKKAIEYINACYNPDSGGYDYMPGRRQPGYARTAAGMCVLQLTGNYDAKEIERGADFLEGEGDDEKFPWYGMYYASHAMHQIGGPRWEEWYRKTKLKLLSRQQSDGHWEEPHDHEVPDYQTAIAVIVLSIPLDYLPIFQS